MIILPKNHWPFFWTLSNFSFCKPFFGNGFLIKLSCLSLSQKNLSLKILILMAWSWNGAVEASMKAYINFYFYNFRFSVDFCYFYYYFFNNISDHLSGLKYNLQSILVWSSSRWWWSLLSGDGGGGGGGGDKPLTIFRSIKLGAIQILPQEMFESDKVVRIIG